MLKAVVNLIDGLPLKDCNAQLEITNDNEHIIITEKAVKGFKTIIVNTYKIPLNNLIETIITTEIELIEKNKSVVGRGVVGGLIFGPAGLLLGGMSGIGSKKQNKKQTIYVISYVSSNGEIKNITFGMPALMVSVTQKYDNQLKKKLETIEKSEQVKEILKKNEQNEFLL